MKQGADALVMWMQEATKSDWTPETTIKNLELTISELMSDLEYFKQHEIASGIQRLIRTMCKKVNN